MLSLEMLGVRVFLVPDLPLGGYYLRGQGIAFIDSGLTADRRAEVAEALVSAAMEDLL
jgi:hypothetical protein